VPVLALIFRSLLGFNGLYGQDAHEYLRYSKALIHYLQYGEHPGQFGWPVLYPFSGAVLGLVFEQHVDFGLQLISMVSFSGALYYMFRILKLLYGNDRAALGYVLCFGLLSPYFLRLGVVVMSDMMGIFFMCAAVFHMLRFRKEKKAKDILAVLVFTAAARLARIPAPVVLVIPFALFGWTMTRNMNWIYFTCGLLICLILFLPELYLGGISYGSFPQEWSAANFFRSDQLNAGSGFLHYGIPNLLFVLGTLVHPGYLLPSALLVFFMRREDVKGEALFFFVLPVLVYLLFLAGFANQNTRLNTFIFPFLLALYFPAFLRLRARFLHQGAGRKAFYTSCTLFQLGLFYFAFNDFYFVNRLEHEEAAYIGENYPGVPVYTQGMGPSLRSYGIKEVYDMDDSEARCGNACLVLIDTRNFEVQWHNLRPMGNWEFIQQHCSVRKVKTFDRGWDLYEIN
jgi:hypothetical protein